MVECVCYSTIKVYYNIHVIKKVHKKESERLIKSIMIKRIMQIYTQLLVVSLKELDSYTNTHTAACS